MRCMNSIKRVWHKLSSYVDACAISLFVVWVVGVLVDVHTSFDSWLVSSAVVVVGFAVVGLFTWLSTEKKDV